MAASAIELALQAALSNPGAALAFVDKLQREQLKATIAEMSRTDAELLGLLDEPSGWMVWAGDASAAPRGSLREALSQAFDLSEDGFAITHIAKVPDDVIVISLTQIRRLWQALGLLDS